MERRVTPPKRVSSPTWGAPSPCEQAPSRNLNLGTWKVLKMCRTFEIPARREMIF